MKKNDIYTFKPLNFENIESNFFDNNYNDYTCLRPPCSNICPRRNCPNFTPPMPCPHRPPQPPQVPPARCCPPADFPECSKDNFRYFLIGYLFGSWN